MNVFINEMLGFDWTPSKEEFDENLACLINSLSILEMLKDCNIFYCRTGFIKLFEELEVIDDCNEYFLFDLRDNLRIAIDAANAVDWTQIKLQKEDHNYFAIVDSGVDGSLINNTSLAEACEYVHQEKGKNMVLNLLKSRYNTYDTVRVSRTEINPPGNISLIIIPTKCKKEDIVPFYFRERTTIFYNHNDKHGENHTVVKNSAKGPISPLECTIAEAEELLLTKAILERPEGKDLIAFDVDRKKYIRFKCENPTDVEKKYHGFHPHDQKFDSKIIQFIERNKDLFG